MATDPIDATIQNDINNIPTAGTAGSTSSGHVWDRWYYPNGYTPQRVSYTSNGQRQVTDGDKLTATQDDAMKLWDRLKATPGAVEQFKAALFWSGAYGTDFAWAAGDTIDRNDIKAASAAIDSAFLNGDSDVFGFVDRMAQKGRETGTPLGQTPDVKNNPGYQIRQYLADNGLKMSDDFVTENVRRIGAGEITVDDVTSHLRDKYLVNEFPAWADSLKSGATVKDIAAPYVTKMAQVLELPEEAIDLSDPKLRSALTTPGTDGKPTFKPLWQFEQDLRQDPRWMQTNQAQDEIAKTASDVLSMFGFQG